MSRLSKSFSLSPKGGTKLQQAQEEMQRLKEQSEEKNRDLEGVQKDLDETKNKQAMDQAEW